MARTGEKPYTVYRGGRTRGKVPISGRDSFRRDGGGPGREAVRRPRRRWTWRRRIFVLVLLVLVLLIAWAVAGYLSVRSGVAAANKRLPAGTASALAPQKGLMLSAGSNILL